ncbi:Phospholipase/carboxylesterase/thioesterase [Penicillium malachiteum]|nr:Phospholipase/carboxylesterase/thioesterase [Penicillium malachiteum]
MPRQGYPAPLVITPLTENHTHTIIGLHGMGRNAERFGHELLASANLQSRLPAVKFVFPTASKRRSTMLKRVPINQWFDIYSLDDPGQRADLQINGLSETTAFLRALITKEASLLGERGYGKVVLWGLSQGCAAGIFAVLGGWPGATESKSIGAFIGMSGWLPFEHELKEILRCDGSPTSPADDNHESSSDEDDDDSTSDEDSEGGNFSDTEDDPFQQSTASDDEVDIFQMEEEPELTLPVQAVDYIRDILDLPALSTSENQQVAANLPQMNIPIFLGHGTEDKKVSVHLGEKMSEVLSTGLGINVTWRPYEGLGHWYRVQDEIEDILKFLASRIQIPLVPEDTSVPLTPLLSQLSPPFFKIT